MTDLSTPPQTDEARPATPAHPFTQVQIDIIVSVGRARPRLSDLLQMGRDAVLPLDTRVDDPVELYVGDRLIARGTLEEMPGGEAGQLAVRLTEVAKLAQEL